MNNTSIKFADEVISCSNPPLLAALLKRVANAAKENFRSTEGELLTMFNAIDKLQDLEDDIKSIKLQVESKPQATPKKKAVRRKRRSDIGKKRQGAALDNIRKAAKKNAAKRRLYKRLEVSKQQVQQNTVS